MATKKRRIEKIERISKGSSVLIVGAGIAGIRAALDLAEAGYLVTLTDQQPNIGGVLMQLDRQFPTNDCGICKMLPTMMRDEISECCLRRNLSHPNIKVYTNSTVDKVTGEVGNFTIEIKQKPLFVDPVKCITCGKCEDVCPEEIPNEFNNNLDTRKAIFTPYPLPNPNTYTLDIDNCTKCGKCVEVCPTDAITLDANEQKLKVEAGAIILSPGLQVFNPEPCKAYGYGSSPNILTSLDFERIYSGLGPYSTERTLLRPSDQRVPKNLAFIQCVGSRNAQIGHEYCSFACCMYSLKEAMLAKDHNPNMDVTIFYMDMRAFGKGYHQYYQQAKNMGIGFVRCRVPAVQKINGTDNLELTLVTESGDLLKEEFELVVLAVGLEAPKNSKELATLFGITLDEYNFNTSDEFTPLATSRPGIYVCGAFTGPKDIPESVTEASAAAALAARNLILSKHEKIADESPQAETASEEPVIGVMLCSCGDDIKSNMKMDELKEYAMSLPGVNLVEVVDYLCLKPEEIKNKLETSGSRINRLIIGACTPYQFEVKFKTSAHRAGLNPAMIELIDLRERIAWVCSDDQALATTKAKYQLAIAYERLYTQGRLPFELTTIPVSHRALVVGGGLAGMASAITIAENDFPVDLVERTDSLGGNLKDIFSTLTHDDTQVILEDMIKTIKGLENINVHLNSTVQELTGHVGEFQAIIKNIAEPKEVVQVEYGAVVLATGASPYEPTEYMYGEDPRVLTQLELERVLVGKELEDKNKMKVFHDKSGINTVAMIQCVGSRNDVNPYCSRVCCSKALKNALNLKKEYPGIKIYIIYQDIMTYGLLEKYYLEARAAGIEFLRYDPEVLPEVKVRKKKNSDELIIKIKDILLHQELNLEPELVILSTGIVPNPIDRDVFDKIGLEYTNSNFLKEANTKFRPVDMLADGIFIAGLAHSPRLISESIVQGQATAGRVLSILNKQELPARRDVSEVNARRCSGCEACITACPYHARVLNPDEKIAMVIEPLCQGCGVCAIVCPNGAAKLRGFQRGQVYSMIDAAVGASHSIKKNHSYFLYHKQRYPPY